MGGVATTYEKDWRGNRMESMDRVRNRVRS